MPDKAPYDEIKDEGGTGLLTEPTLQELKDEVDAIASESRDNVWTARVDYEDIRYCRWDKQSADGLKHKEENADEDPEPFDGAADMRVRMADMLINEDVMLLLLSATRAQINFRGTEITDIKKAGNMAIMMRWVLKNYLGIRWIKELMRTANFFLADTPAVALLGIYWRKEISLKMQPLTVDELMQLYVNQAIQNIAEWAQSEGSQAEAQIMTDQANQAAEDFRSAIASPEISKEILAPKLIEFFPTLRIKRAKKVINDLRETGRAEFPVPYTRRDGPDVQAKRLYEDWFIRLNTREFSDAPIYFEAEWLTKTQIIEKQISDGWDADFVEEVIGRRRPDGSREGGHEAAAAFPEYVRDRVGHVVSRDSKYYKGMYQILTAYYQATNEDGVPGRYYVVFHKEISMPGTERRLIDYAHGEWPGIVIERELTTNRSLDARGIAEIAGTYQGLMKVYCDSFGNHAQLAGVPPIITRNRNRMGVLHIKPLVELQAKREGDFEWMDPPTYPRTVIDMIKELRRQNDEYFGRENAEVPPDQAALQREFKVIWWLMNIREALWQIFKLCQQYMPDELLQRITNKEGIPIFRSREEIQGQYDLELVFDPRDMDPAYLETIAKIVKDLLLAMDRDKTIQTSPIVSMILWRIAPELAEASIIPVEQANQKEIEDEIKAYQKIRAGTEPELPDDGSINYQLRMQLYQNMQQMNPQIYNDMAPDKLTILQSRLQRMATLAQQFGENVEIGRQGGKTALPLGGAQAAPGAPANMAGQA
ncbi:MAG: hypothetical protein WC551_12555 [Patescibacteria group bacterium]